MGLFGTNGVRGVFGSEFTLEMAQRLSIAIARHWGRGPVLVGYDGRHGGSIIADTVCAALNYSGLNCNNAGLVPTPCLEYGVRELGYSGGIMITASHNPPPYNGMKAIASDGVEIAREHERVIERHYYSDVTNEAPTSQWGATGTETRTLETYISGIISKVNAKAISGNNYTVAIDMGNGAQAAAAPLLCQRLNCNMIPIHHTIDGDFPGRGPEPTPQNLQTLSGTITKEKAHLGIAFDGDGDRSILCDETGNILTGDASALMLVRYLLEKNPRSKVVTCINSGDAIEDMVHDSQVIRTKVGSVEVSRMMVDTGALAGFEENGGFMYGNHNCVRDGLMTLALTLDMMAHHNSTISQETGTLPPSYTTKTKVPCDTHMASAIMDKLYSSYSQGQREDGVKIILGQSHWVMIRPSGTEPILRIYAQAPTGKMLEKTIQEYTDMVETLTRTT